MNKKYLSVVVLIIGLIQAQASGQEVKEKEIELEKIIVTNRRASTLLSEASENVAVIDEDEIEELPAQNLGEAMKYVSGVSIAPTPGFGRNTSSISIQGSESRQTRIMIDGIPFNSQSSGQVNLATLPIEDIARIEVIKGASSSLWGSSLGGVINVITKDTGTTLIPKGSLTTSFAEFRTRKDKGEVSGKIGALGYYLFSSYMESGGNGPRDDVLEKKGFGKISYDLKELGKITGSFGYSGAQVHRSAPDNSWEDQPYRSRYGKIGWEIDSGDTDIKVDLKHSRQETITKLYNSIEDQAPFRRIECRDMLYQLSLNSATRLRGKDLLVLGADFDWDTVKTTYLLKTKSVKLQAPYAQYTLKLDPWDFNLGLRYDFNSEFKGQMSPAFGLLYALKDKLDTLIRIGVSRAFNAPPLLWKYYELDLSGMTTNLGIKPERAWVYEIGVESKPLSRCWIKLSLYRSDATDAIAAAKNESGLYYMKNFEKFRRQGGEFQFKINILEGLDFLASGAFNDIENRATKKTVKGGGKARQSFNLGIEYKNKYGFSLSLKGYYNRWNAAATTYTDPQTLQDIVVDPHDRKTICDLRTAQEFKHLILFLNIYNLNNSKYWEDYFLRTPRRYFEGGVTLKW